MTSLKRRNKIQFVVSVSIFLIASFIFSCKSLNSATIDSKNEDEINLVKGDLETIKVFDLTRVSITQPEVADIVNLDTSHILMLAKQPGQTTLFIWDKYGKRSIIVRVSGDDLDQLKLRLKQLFAEAGIKGITMEINSLEGKLVLSG